MGKTWRVSSGNGRARVFTAAAKYRVLSGNWLHEVCSARRFIAAYRAIVAGELTPAFRRAFVTRREPGDVSDGP